jgi:hypothetical protein
MKKDHTTGAIQPLTLKAHSETMHGLVNFVLHYEETFMGDEIISLKQLKTSCINITPRSLQKF